MNLRHFRHFVVVAEEQHFGRAAARLGIEQSPLSRSIRQFEAHLGCRLIDRSRLGSGLTTIGAALLPEVRDLLARVARLKDTALSLTRGQTGSIRLGLCDAVASRRLSACLSNLRSWFPTLTVEVHLVDGDRATSVIEDGDVDAVIIHERRNTESLCRVHLWDERLDVIVATDHFLSQRATVPLSSLLEFDEVLVVQPWASAADNWLCKVARSESRPIMRIVPTVPALLTAICLDVGIALVPAGIAESFTSPDVRVRHFANRLPRLSVVMLTDVGVTHPALDALGLLARQTITMQLSAQIQSSDAPAETPDRSP